MQFRMPISKFSARKQKTRHQKRTYLKKRISVSELVFFPNRNYEVCFVFITEALKCYKCKRAMCKFSKLLIFTNLFFKK